MPPRDPRVRALWVLLRRRQLLERNAWIKSDAAPHLAEGTRPTAIARAPRPDAGAAPGVGSARARGRCARYASGGHQAARGNPAAAASASGHAAARGDSATAAGDAAAPGDATAVNAMRRPVKQCEPPMRPAATFRERRTLSGAVQDASALYRRFSRLPARSVQRVSHQRLVPPVVVELGRLMAVVYRSDKWVGHPRTYIHYMEDPPRLVSDVAGRQPLRHRRELPHHRAGDRRMKLGLDELIIVNPGSPPTATSWFLGADGGALSPRRSTTSRGRRSIAERGRARRGRAGAEVLPRRRRNSVRDTVNTLTRAGGRHGESAGNQRETSLAAVRRVRGAGEEWRRRRRPSRARWTSGIRASCASSSTCRARRASRRTCRPRARCRA